MNSSPSATVVTSAYGIVGKTTQTRVHFFPNAAVTVATQTVSCALTLFGRGLEPKSVMIEGGRLGSPDGIRLEDAFPSIRSEIAGLVGITVQLSCSNPRLNLAASQCVVEFVADSFMMSGLAAPFTKLVHPQEQPGSEGIPSARRRAQLLIATRDYSINSSLIVVNGSEALVKPEVRRLDGTSVPVGTVPPRSVTEIPLDELVLKEVMPQELAWGLSRSEGLLFGEVSGSAVAYYMLYRDAERRPVCSQAL